MTSPYFYIIFSLSISSAALSLIFFIAWRNFGRQPHALTWSLAFLAGSLQWGSALAAGMFPTTEMYLLTKSALTISLVTLGLHGHCQRTEFELFTGKLFPAAIAVFMVVAWFTVVDPHFGFRVAAMPAYAAITLFLSAYMILQYREKPRASEWVTAVFIALFGLSRAVVAVLAATQGAIRQPEIMERFEHITYLTLPAGYMGMSMFIILMMASDISAKMKSLAVRDQLTGLLNRRGFVEYGERAFSAAKRNGSPLSVILTDIDRFKFINDKYGHAAGDNALVHFSGMVAANRRNEDTVARIGGEEFALLLPGTDLASALAIADQLCHAIGSTPLNMTGVGLPMTSSFGVATMSDRDSSLDDMVRRADRAMYRSKRAGRNQVDIDSSQLMLSKDGQLGPLPSG